MYHKSLHKKEEKGQGLVEYALILVLVAVVVIAAMMVLGPRIGNIFSKVNSSISGVGSIAPAAQQAAPTQNLGTCYLRWTGTQWVHWYDNQPEIPGVCP
jgi:pilus assembly protein Flp/PilA